MTISRAQQTELAPAPSARMTVALDAPARNCLGRLQEHTAQSQADLANCALTWYEFFDTQLRAGYNLTLWNAEGKAYTLSLSAPPRETDSGRPVGQLCFKANPLSWAGAPGPHHRPLDPTFTPAKPWLASTSSRGSPSTAPRQGGARHCTVVPSRRPGAQPWPSPKEKS
jgi:hypothetical protein